MQTGFNPSAHSPVQTGGEPIQAGGESVHQNGDFAHNGNGHHALRLSELAEGQQATVDALHLPQDLASRLMELGFVPGHIVYAGRSAPGGDPRVFRIDGSQIALRRETTYQIFVKPGS
jgi:ferrous iron transport protein A